MFTVHVRVTLRPSILDPEGKAIRQAVRDLGMAQIEEVRTGSFFEIRVDAETAASAEAIAREACRKLLANPVTEDFEVLAVERVDEVPSEG